LILDLDEPLTPRDAFVLLAHLDAPQMVFER
jgi:hypothetical protein